MANKKKLQLGSINANKFIAEIPAKKIQAQVQFRHDIIESQKRINYQNEFDRLQGAKKLVGLNPNVKSQMKSLQHKARQSLNGGDTHRLYTTKF